MSAVKVGNTELEISEIVFGAWAIGGWMWGGTDDRNSIRALDASIDIGITSIDTAPAYGFGHSEKIVGKAIRGKRDKVQILTKYGIRWDTKKGKFFIDTLEFDLAPEEIEIISRSLEKLELNLEEK